MDRHLTKEPRIDFFLCLDTDVSLLIANFIDDEADIVRFTAVSRFWREYAISNGLAKQATLKLFPELHNIVRVVDTSEGIHVPTEWEIQERDHKAYIALLRSVAKSKLPPKDCIQYAVDASSTHRLPDESIVNTLNPRDRISRGASASYWSSIGHWDPQVPERLTYKIRDGIWSIVQVNIQPFQAFFEAGNPIYSARAVRFRFGKPNGPKPQNRNQLPEIVWYYTSPQFPMMQVNRLQPFKLPKPVLCSGGYFQVELLGRVQRQELTRLFYLCVSYVRVDGRPLFPAFAIENLEQNGQYCALRYDPDKVACILEEQRANDVVYLQQMNQQFLFERIVLLEAFYLGVGRGPNNPHAWDEAADANHGAPHGINAPHPP